MDNSLLKHLFPARLLPRWSILFLDLAMVGGAVLVDFVFGFGDGWRRRVAGLPVPL